MQFSRWIIAAALLSLAACSTTQPPQTAAGLGDLTTHNRYFFTANGVRHAWDGQDIWVLRSPQFSLSATAVASECWVNTRIGPVRCYRRTDWSYDHPWEKPTFTEF